MIRWGCQLSELISLHLQIPSQNRIQHRTILLNLRLSKTQMRKYNNPLAPLKLATRLDLCPPVLNAFNIPESFSMRMTTR